MSKKIEIYSRKLKLPYTRNNYKQMTKAALAQNQTHEEFLEELLMREVEARDNNALKNRIKRANFPNNITFDTFEMDHLAPDVKNKILELKDLNFLEDHSNIILVGNPGVGKTALATCLGMKACMQGHSVLFINTPTLLIQLRETMSNNQITSYKRKFENYDLVIIDELGYVNFDKESGQILFHLLASRNEEKSIIITSNLPIDQWNQVFSDTNVTGAIVDRMIYRSHLIDMSGVSFRYLTTERWIEEEKDKNREF